MVFSFFFHHKFYIKWLTVQILKKKKEKKNLSSLNINNVSSTYCLYKTASNLSNSSTQFLSFHDVPSTYLQKQDPEEIPLKPCLFD